MLIISACSVPATPSSRRLSCDGLEHLALGQRHAEALDGLAQRLQLLGAGLLVDAVEQAHLLRLQRLGGGDIGEDHEVLDHPVRIQPVAEGDRQHLALVRQDDPPLGQVEVQRLALVAGQRGRPPCGPERTQDRLEQGAGGLVGLAVDGGLHLAVGQRAGRAHQGADETVAPLRTMGVEHHAHGDAGAFQPLVQRAEIARQALGQHRHHPVGEVGGVAAPPRLAVERRAGGHVVGHVGDRHPDDVAAGVGGVVVGFGVDRVVVVAGVRGVDGDQRQVAQVLALAERHGLCLRGLGECCFGKFVGDPVLVDGDQRDRARRPRVAEARDDARPRQAVAAGRAELFGLDQFALARTGAVAVSDLPVAVGALVDGGDAAARLAFVVDADDPPRPHADAADHPGGQRRLLVLGGHHAAEQPVAGTQCGIVAAGAQQDARRGALALPLGRLGPEVARRVGAGDPHQHDGRQCALRADLAAALLDRALAGHLRQHLLQLGARRALEPEGARDVALAGDGRVLAQECEKLILGGKPAHRPALARPPGARHGENAHPQPFLPARNLEEQCQGCGGGERPAGAREHARAHRRDSRAPARS